MTSNSETLNTLELLQKEAAKILNIETVEPHVGLGELGIDSLNVVELIVYCEQLYGAIDPEQLNITQYTTLGQIDAQLKAQQAA
ncbi:acyl carrier protein [Pseudomonas chlororaphis]|jgi:acyl carrier protein|uniref:acyl carrier protein n=1 Tax=Pseudomonas chlororaphis TaxID=587753 RepID=UPI0015DF164F|nr:acyl carrier protein [Pseudomonas chlororaphis]QLL12558.1 acyl carrier protein [Pseudomonas chlororaphis subsp. aurantiaca]